MKNSCAALYDAENAPPEPEMKVEIERFLNGETNGGVLFEALYGHIGQEPIPTRLLAVVRSGHTGEVVSIDPAARR